MLGKHGKHFKLFPCLFPQSTRDFMRPTPVPILVPSGRDRNGSSRPIDARKLGDANSVSGPEAAANQIRNANRHAARRIERQILKPEGRIERPHIIVQRMRQHAEAANLVG